MTGQIPYVEDLLYLLTVPNIGPGRIRRLFQQFGSFQDIRRAPVRKLIHVAGIDLKIAEQIKNGGNDTIVANQMALLDKFQIDYITIWDKAYPSLLKRISDPPIVLFYKGDFKEQHSRSIAVVGTRTPSAYGKMMAAEITRQLVAKGITVVSGLARGVDSIAHQTAIGCGGETIAVLGCGVDRCYPPENYELYRKIPDHGAVISEYFIGTGPDAVNFPKRNRIISGLSLGTLVVEAGRKSGAVISAILALNQNREVFAIPGNINNPRSEGSNLLIKQGAKLVQNVEDILEEIGEFSHYFPIPPKPIPDDLGPIEKAIISSLSEDPKHIDRLVMELRETPSTILSGLLTLELMGLVQQLPGKMFIRL
ncbi:MAG: DNA-protecting protein DprA [Calditrichaeota bacterium]|nr:MAG: DNA-protecting protein DprA [Calditrichota bacterium]